MLNTNFLTVKDAADRLKVNPQTVRRWIRRGVLRAARVPGGKGWRIREDDLISALTEPSPEELQHRREAVQALLEIRKLWAGTGLTVEEIRAEDRADLENRGASRGS